MSNRLFKFFNGIFLLLSKPFNKEIRFFIITFLMSAIVDVVGFTQFESFPKAIFIALHHYVICYIFTLILCVLPKSISFFYKYFIYAALCINFLIDIVCVYSFHFTFDQEIPAILIGTNGSEAIEFIETFVPFKLVLIIILSLTLFYYLNRFLYRQNININNKAYMLLLVVVLGIVSFVFVSAKNFGNVSVTKISTFLKATTPPDLSKYFVNPRLVDTTGNKPKNVVMIIGESFSKKHSSLYGYEKLTNPYLQTLVDDSLLYVFEDISSPETGTIPVFKCLMSTYKPEFEENVKWYECLTLQEVLKKSGYYTFWISNQSKKGIYDNIVSKYALLCNDNSFVGNKFSGIRRGDLDELIVDTLKYYKKNVFKDTLQFTFVHLMGSHSDFSSRYPSKFAKYTSDDYKNKIESQRKILSEYDNSILYNDSVVYEIINQYKNDESIILYFPDHSIDVFDSRDDYVGHAIHNSLISIEVSTQIPFMIYMSKKYQEKYPENKRRIINSINKKFRTDDIIYTIMDIIGVEFEDNDDVVKYSLFR